MANEITIAGGGLAGLTLGILLRQKPIPVTILEAGNYPRHRVCGEFISGSGLAVLRTAGLLETIQSQCGRLAHSAALIDQRGGKTCLKLPEPALCVSRYSLDALLANEFERAGGVLRIKERWTSAYSQEGVVRATGRRPPEPRSGSWKWFGLKVHCRSLELTADLEMHLRSDGYIGLCRLPGDEVNVCGLFRTRTTVPNLAAEWKAFLAGPEATPLSNKLRQASYDEDSFCAVAALQPNGAAPGFSAEMRIGDCMSMIPPLTGNGMSIAFESAFAAAESMAPYAHNQASWAQSVRSFQLRWASQTNRRLRFDRLLHPFLFNSLMQRLFFSNKTVAAWSLQKVFHATR